MSATSILDQLLKAGVSAASQYNARQSDAGRYATGAAAGSLLTLLLGSRGGRRQVGRPPRRTRVPRQCVGRR